MIHNMFTVYDSKAEAYLPPFYEQTKGSALRAFMDTCSRPDHPFYKHPEDYTLFHLGSFDDNDKSFDILRTAEPLGTAIELKPNGAGGDQTEETRATL